MALDNAQFISELSITDPPGTDPLNQGDDQIRTTKRATQQSFPNIDAPVPQTAAQMAQMAIKNEVNIFTQQQTFANNILLDSGGNNSILFDTSGVRVWQILHVGGSSQFELRRFVGGALIDAPMQVNNAFGEFTFLADASFNRTVLLGDGVVGAPAYRFTNDTGMGMYRVGSNILGFAVGGAQVFSRDLSTFQHNGSASATLIVGLNQNAGTGAVHSFEKSNVVRWQSGGAGVDQETYNVTRFNDAGAFLDNPVSVNRATGLVSFVAGAGIKVSGSGVNIVGNAGAGTGSLILDGDFGGVNFRNAAGVLRSQWFLFNSNNDMDFAAFNSAGVSVGTILTADLATRVVDFKVRPTVNGVPL